MAIIKTHFFNVSFEFKDLIKILIKMTEYQDDLFPQDSKKIVNNVKGVSVMDQTNPYNEPLDNLYHVLDRLHISSNVQDQEYKEINLSSVNNLIEEINTQIDSIVDIKENILKEKDENDQAIIVLKNLKDSNISVDDVKNTKFITCRFGRIPIGEFDKIKYYRDYEFVFKELKRTKQYVWIVYVGLTKNIYEIDNAFSSMAFELIELPDFAHGKIDEAIAMLEEESAAMEKYIEKTAEKLEGVKNKYQSQLLEMFTQVYNLKKLYDKCCYVVDLSHKGAIYLFTSLELKDVQARFDDIDSVKIIELPANIYENRNIVAPVFTKNNWLSQPFENILSIQTGDRFDPTMLVALMTLIIGAVCLGDIGVGLFLIILGFLVMIKGPNNFGKILKRVGLAVLIGGLVYGTFFYQIEVYPAIVEMPIHIIHTLIFGVGIWVVLIVVLLITKKVMRRSIKV
ncbi:hypothetical protein [uncultured Thomasclavelia sp.]|uniref:hypothetical protein n=1 Tax=uncultured Thomasclavelia sp. TaxID=3025759 RepID=UPI0025CE6B9E|nr:hypothetical protein [uncultured Thomasclavelia sp.]